MKACPYLLVLCFVACNGEAGAPPTDTASFDPPSEPAAGDPRLANVVRALEAGLPDAAWTLLDQIGPAGGAEAALLRARAALLGGDAVGALREIEVARELAPEDGRVFATEAEVLVALDRIAAAQEVVRAGWKRAGKTAELERARGVLLVRTPGGALEGLDALEEARKLDPDLPFLGYPLAQAHLLAGRQLLAAAPAESLRHAEEALTYDSDDLDFLELKAEAYASMLMFEQALAIYARLEEDGRELGLGPALLHQRYATQLLLVKDRERAVVHYLVARAKGVDDEGLGFGADLLREESLKRIDAGIELYDAGEVEPAVAAFTEALRYDPRSLEARNHLAVCRFREEDYRGAAETWTELLELARANGESLPDPVHLNLARAWRLDDESAKARQVLADYLDTQPEGPWAAETRDLLAALEAEALLRNE